MCRFVAYTGPQTLMHHLLFDTENSLVAQSKHATKRKRTVNGDGFGIGWYPLSQTKDPEPGTFVSIEPAWNNRNLHNISAKIATRQFFAHVRDASSGMSISRSNCHPFQNGRFLWMHNGWFDKFLAIKRNLINTLSERAFGLVQGNTDSEYAFALFLDAIEFEQTASIADMQIALLATIKTIHRLRREAGQTSAAQMNFALGNGRGMIATRLATTLGVQPPSLYYTHGTIAIDEHGCHCPETSAESAEKATIIASEPLSNKRGEKHRPGWHKVERGYMVTVDNVAEPRVSPLNLDFS